MFQKKLLHSYTKLKYNNHLKEVFNTNFDENINNYFNDKINKFLFYVLYFDKFLLIFVAFEIL